MFSGGDQNVTSGIFSIHSGCYKDIFEPLKNKRHAFSAALNIYDGAFYE